MNTVPSIRTHGTSAKLRSEIDPRQGRCKVLSTYYLLYSDTACTDLHAHKLVLQSAQKASIPFLLQAC